MVTPPPIQLANLGMADSLILMVLALVVFGPRRLPQIGRQIGKLMYEFRKASNDFKFQMEEELRSAEEAERRKKEETERQRVAALAAQSQASVSAPAPTVEAAADIGAVEPPTASVTQEGSTYPGPPSPEQTASSPEPALVIQPPQTGEQVSAISPFSAAPLPPSMEQAVSEVNPDADIAANAEGVEAQIAAIAPPAVAEPTPNSESASPTPPKETVSQHG